MTRTTRRRGPFLLAPLALAAAGAIGQQPEPSTPQAEASETGNTLDLGTTSITGNRELPKVLHIVPWKRSDFGDLVGRPFNTLLDEALAPIDPDVFERQLDYYELLDGDEPDPESNGSKSQTQED